MKDRLKRWWLTSRERIHLLFAKRVVWLTDERRDQLGEPSASPALVGIIGREFYEERRKTYPIRSYFELDRIIRLEQIESRRRLTFIGLLRDDHREVIFFDLDDRFDPQELNALFWIPETFLVARMMPRDGLATIDRAGLCYFIADSGVNMVRGGAVRSPELFGFAIGLSSNHGSIFWSGEDLPRKFFGALRKVPLSGWLKFASPDIAAALRRHWQPAALTAAIAFVGYLLVVSAYLWSATKLREREMTSLGAEVTSLLEKQRGVDQLTARQDVLARLMSEQKHTYLLWGLAADAISAGGAVSGLYLRDGEMVLRGQAKVATNVLSKLASRKDVSNARFGAPVRQLGEYEEFSITFTLSSAMTVAKRVEPPRLRATSGG